MDTQSENWEYETKCRRCSKFSKWYFGSTDNIDWMAFSKAMISAIQYPRQYKCETCDKQTVQDVVSYSEPNNMKI